MLAPPPAPPKSWFILHTPLKPSRNFLFSHPLTSKNYPIATLYHLSCESLDNIHPPHSSLWFPHPHSSSQRKWEMKNNTGKERSSDEMSERVMKPEKFLMQEVSHLCVQKVIYSEWSSGRRDLEGTQFHQVGEMAVGGEAMGLLMYSALTIMECNFKNMHLFKQRQMDSHKGFHTVWRCTKRWEHKKK